MIADLERRLRALETAPRASYTTIRDGTTVWRGDTASHQGIAISSDLGDPTDAAMYVYTADGQNRIYVGTNIGVAVIYVDNPDKSGRVLTIDSVYGMLGPYGVAPWQKNPGQSIDSLGRATTTSGSFQVGWRSLCYVTSAQFGLEYAVDLGGASSAEVSVTAKVYHDDRAGTPNGTRQTVFGRTVSATGSFVDTASIPSSIWVPSASPVGSMIDLEFSARVASGAGTVAWAPILPGQFK